MGTRARGHVKIRESASEWEKAWISIYASEGYAYRLVAALVYGLLPHNVTSGEISRVGRLARQAGCGCNAYRTGRSDLALERIKGLHKENRSDGPPVITFALLRALGK